MINIDNITINIHEASGNTDETAQPQSTFDARDELVNMLRIISADNRFKGQTVIIPDECEQYGFAEGNFDLPDLLHSLADMLE